MIIFIFLLFVSKLADLKKTAVASLHFISHDSWKIVFSEFVPLTCNIAENRGMKAGELNDFNPGLDRMLDPINDKMGEYVENVERELEKEAQDKYNNKTISKNYSN